MQQSPETIIELRHVTKRFGSIVAVDDLNFTVNAGETVSLLGPSGCGKTTTLRLISGFEHANEGVIEIAGESMAGKRPYERNVGLLFQHYALFPHMTVAENVGYGLKQRHWTKADIAHRVGEMLRLVQLQGFEDRRPTFLSGGQQQRVALARVLATKPKLVLLDEPLSALDAKLRTELRLELKQILTAVGSTTIVVTHDQDEAMSLADRIIVMNRGRIEQQGTPDEIYMQPVTTFVAAFVGRANWFHGRIATGSGQESFLLTTDAGTAIAIPNPGVNSNGKLSVCIRPERISVVDPNGTALQPGDNHLSGTLVDIVNMGAEIHYIVDAPDGRLMVVEPNRVRPNVQRGDRVGLQFRAEDCVVLPRISSAQ